ncbi:MAG: type I-E CRISPR-associated protein Cse2/CasB [Thermostichus sp. DG02_5_bins_236]
MTVNPKSSRLERPVTFLDGLKKRIKNDSGAKATLKRALSGDNRHLRQTYPLLLPTLEGIPEWQQDIWIFVACLSVYHNQDPEPAPRSFAQSCLDLHNKVPSNGPERRFRSLLDTTLADIQSPITALVRQFKSQDIKVYYPHLIADLCNWAHPDQFVQDRWARSFWRAPQPPEISGKAGVDV